MYTISVKKTPFQSLQKISITVTYRKPRVNRNLYRIVLRKIIRRRTPAEDLVHNFLGTICPTNMQAAK